MTGTGVLIGILAGIGVIAVIMIVAVVVIGKKLHAQAKGLPKSEKNENVGFAVFQKRASDLLEDAPRGSKVSASFPIPPIEVFIKVSGRRDNMNSYQLEIRMGYKRLDHLSLIEREVEEQNLVFERVDKGKGSIKLLSEKVDDIAILLGICRQIKRAMMFDLDDNGINVSDSIRQDTQS
ncbi:MAG: hypothetical protein ABJ246_13710 [Paracoccaceae bacterium]